MTKHKLGWLAMGGILDYMVTQKKRVFSPVVLTAGGFIAGVIHNEGVIAKIIVVCSKFLQ